MDALDVRILRAMGGQPYDRVPRPLDALQPPRLARVTGASVNTVKERLARMQASGVIAGYKAVPNLRHFGLGAEALYLRFDDDASKDAAIPRLLGLDGVLEVADFLGRGLCVDYAFRDAGDRAEKIARMSGWASGGEVPRRFYVRDTPEVSRALTPLDWRILAALRADPRAGAADLAGATGVSARTVKRHLSRMAAEGSIFLVPIVDPSRAEGLFLFALLVYLEEGSGPHPMAALREAFEAEHVHAFVPSSTELGSFDLLLYARSTSEVEALRRRAEGVRGVLRAEAWLFRSVLDRGAWIDGLIAQRLAKAPRLRAPAPPAH